MNRKAAFFAVFVLISISSALSQETPIVNLDSNWFLGWNISPFSASLVTHPDSEEGPIDFSFNTRLELMVGYKIISTDAASVYFMFDPYGWISAAMGVGSNFEAGLRMGVMRFGKNLVLGAMMPILTKGVSEYIEHVEFGEDISHNEEYENGFFDPPQLDLLIGMCARYQKPKDKSGLLFWAFNLQLTAYEGGFDGKRLGILMGAKI